MTQGDPIWYAQTCRGGYGMSRDVPALFERQSDRRATITVVLRSTGERKTIHVDPKNIRPRDPAKGFDPFAPAAASR